MRTLRIFISSPGDVADERQIAGAVIERLQGKYWSFVRLDDVFWEQKVIRSTAHYQDELANPGECEMVVGILWSRLGSLMPEKFRKQSGERYQSGTEWELEMAFDAYEQSLARTRDPVIAKPDIIVYRRNQARPSFEDPEQEIQATEQVAKLESYLRGNFWFPDGTIKRPITNYETLAEFENKLSRNLEELILRQIPGLKPGFEPPPISGSPFKGLQVFDFIDSDRYFGRNREIREIQHRLVTNARAGLPFILIYGGSGYGKSSLMRAGLAPVLTRPGGSLDEIQGWRRVSLQPAKGSGSLCERLARTLVQPPTPEEAELSRQHRHWPLAGLAELANELTTAQPWDIASLSSHLSDDDLRPCAITAIVQCLERLNRHLLLELDQLEEIFTVPEIDAGQRASFLRAIRDLCLSDRVWVVATMRSEFFPRVAEQPELFHLVGKDRGYILPPPDLQSLREIIRYPALAARLDFERRIDEVRIDSGPAKCEFLHDQILEDAKTSPDALPLLEFTLQQLFESRREQLLTWEAYIAAGGLKGAIAKRAREVYQSLDSSAREARHKIFAALVHMDATRNTVTRQRAPLDQLKIHPSSRTFLQAFLDAHLLITDEDTASKEPVVTLAHEALISHWDEFAAWIRDHQGDLLARQRLREQTNLWTQNQQKKSYLLSEARLAEAQRVSGQDLFTLTPEECDFLKLSQQRSKKRLRVLQTAVAIFALLAVAAAGFGWMASTQQKRAEAGETEALRQSDRAETESHRARHALSQSDLRQAVERSGADSLPFLVRAVRLDSKNTAAVHLLSSLTRLNPWAHPVFGTEWVDRTIKTVQFSSNAGHLIVDTDLDGGNRAVFDLKTGTQVSEQVETAGAPTGLASSRLKLEFQTNTGTAVAAGGFIKVFEDSPDEPLWEIYQSGYLETWAFSPYDRFLLSLTPDGTARVFDMATGTQLGSDIHTDAKHMVWSPDLSCFALWNDSRVEIWTLPCQEELPSDCPDEDPEESTPWTSSKNFEAKLSPNTSLAELSSVIGFGSPSFVATSPLDGLWAVVKTDGPETDAGADNVLIWDPVRKMPVKTFPLHVFDTENGKEGPQGIVFSPSGRWAAFGGGPGNFPSELHVFNTQTWELEASLQSSDTVFSATFSPDETLLAADVLGHGVQFYDWRSRLNVSGPKLGDDLGEIPISWLQDGRLLFSSLDRSRCIGFPSISAENVVHALADRAETLCGQTWDERGNLVSIDFKKRFQSSRFPEIPDGTNSIQDGRDAAELLAAGHAPLDAKLNLLAAFSCAELAATEEISMLSAAEQYLRVALGELKDLSQAESEALRFLATIDRILKPDIAANHRRNTEKWLQEMRTSR